MRVRHYPLRLPPEDAKAVDQVCRETRASFNRVVSLCVRKALPAVKEGLSAATGRVTNVDPLPKSVLRKLYSKHDELERVTAEELAASQSQVEPT